MKELQPDQSSLLFDKALFLSYQKVPKDEDYLFLFKGVGSLLIKRLSIKVTLKLLLLVVRMDKSSKSGE